MVDLTQTELVEWRDLKSQRWGKALKAHILCFWKEEEEKIKDKYVSGFGSLMIHII